MHEWPQGILRVILSALRLLLRAGLPRAPKEPFRGARGGSEKSSLRRAAAADLRRFPSKKELNDA